MGWRKINTRIKIYCFLLIANCLLPIISFAQSPSVKTFVDRSDILIGEQIKYKVTVSFPTGTFKPKWFTPPDSVAHFEIVDQSKIDTTTENTTTTLQQVITLTSFDSGKWNTPAFKISFDAVKNDSAINLFTDSIAINVGYAAADSTNQLRDIKPIMEVSIKPNYWAILIRSAIIFLVIVIIISLIKKLRKKKANPKFINTLSPFTEAMQNLEKLRQLNLQNADEIKQYHSKLATIFKWYISRKQGVSIMNKTTGDVLIHLTENNLPKEIITNIATVLRSGDAAKFAKYLPTPIESEECLSKIKETINFIHTSNNRQ
jgi:hypothetical protein